MSDIQSSNVQPAVENVPQEIKTFADAGLDLAALAAQQVSQVEGAKDPEVAAQKIVALESRVEQLIELINDAKPVIDAAKTLLSNAPDFTTLQSSIDKLMNVVPELAEFEPRVKAIEEKLPEVMAVVDEMENLLPENWKARVSSLLAMAKQHFGI